MPSAAKRLLEAIDEALTFDGTRSRKPPFDFPVNPMQPLLNALHPLLVVFDLRFQVPDPTVGRSKLL